MAPGGRAAPPPAAWGRGEEQKAAKTAPMRLCVVPLLSLSVARQPLM